MKPFPSLIIVCIAACVSAAGCSSSNLVPEWQSGLQAYVSQQADNDMNTLRDSPDGAEGPLRRFGVLDGNSEAQGVLLGYHQVVGRWWYIYLVGVTNSRDIGDIHMMAVSRRLVGNSALFDWVGGQPDRAATGRYRAARLAAWHKGNPPDASEDSFEITFPGPDDAFTLQLAGDTATASDDRSGAQWTLVFTTSASPAAQGQSNQHR